MCVLCIPNVSAGRCFCSEIPRKFDAAKIETFCEINALERLEGFDAGGRWAPGSGDGELLAYSLIPLFTIKVRLVSRQFET